jgi:hypothetical protein
MVWVKAFFQLSILETYFVVNYYFNATLSQQRQSTRIVSCRSGFESQEGMRQ